MVLESPAKRDKVLQAVKNSVRKVMMCHTKRTNILVSFSAHYKQQNVCYKCFSLKFHMDELSAAIHFTIVLTSKLLFIAFNVDL
jgi:hypothetical protein